MSRLLSAHSHLPGWQQLRWWCLYTNMLMVYSLNTSAESEYAAVERFSWKHLCISRRIWLCILKNTTAVAVPLMATLSDLFNLQTHTFYFFPSSTGSSIENLRLLTTELLFLATLLRPIWCGLWPPGAQCPSTHNSRLHAPENNSVSFKI